MKESDLRIGENSKPVAFPADIICMDVRCLGQRLLQDHIKRLSIPRKFVVELDDGIRSDGQFAKMLERPLSVVIRNFDFMAKKRNLDSCFRADKGTDNFVFTTTVDGLFATGTSVIIMYKTTCGQLAGLKVFLNVDGGVVTWRNVLASAVRVFIEINVNEFVYLIRLLSEMSLVSKQCSSFFRIFKRFFLFIFLKR
jgi:hypothetical protein